MLPNGLRLSRRRIPIGVLGVIYEARPNVTIDIATLSLRPAMPHPARRQRDVAQQHRPGHVIHDALARVGLPPAAVQYIDNPGPRPVRELLRLDNTVT